MTATPLLDLDDPRARDRAIAGGKAALLAAARAEGLPVVDGVVVPRTASETAFAAGASALEQPGGHGSARRHALQCQPDAGLVHELAKRVRALGEPVIVRSSALVEDDGAWSGAFASMGDVEADGLSSALRSCWASSFSPDVLERREELETPVADLQLALLVQRHLDTEAAGTAEVLGNGAVRVVATRGSPAALMQGWDVGVTFVVHGADAQLVSGDGAVAERVVVRAAVLALAAQQAVGATSIEWGACDGEVYLLQCRRGADHDIADDEPDVPAAPPSADLADPGVLRVARVLARYRGYDGLELIVPWAVGLPGLPQPMDTPAAQDAARASDELAAVAWGLPPAAARQATSEMLEALRTGDVKAAIERLRQCRPVDAAAAAAVLAAVEGMGDRERSAALRWEPFLYDVARTHGRVVRGSGIVPGVGAGAAVLLDEPWTAGRLRPGGVLFVERPLPGFSPLLWRASALVCRVGSAAAHLFEVAGSLGLPTVVADVDATAGQLVAVDGLGDVWLA